MTVPPIAFSTLACPEWTAIEVVERAAAIGYDAIEWRGGPEGHVRVDWDARRRRDLRTRMADAGVTALAVTAYTSFVSADPGARTAQTEGLIRHLDLAADLGASAVRAFVGIVEDAAERPEVLARIVDALAPAADHAAARGVAVALEPHDDFVRSEALGPVLRALDHPAVGAIWEIGNAWEAGEEPAVGLAVLAPWIRYVQLKDGRGRGAAWRLTPLGAGEVPLHDALTALARRGPLPPLSLEWERAWHPELDPAERALGPALDAIRDLVHRALERAG